MISEWVKSPSIFVSKDEYIGNKNGLPPSPVGKLLFKIQTPAQISPMLRNQSLLILLVGVCGSSLISISSISLSLLYPYIPLLYPFYICLVIYLLTILSVHSVFDSRGIRTLPYSS